MSGWHRGTMERESMLVQSFYYGRIGREGTERLLERYGHNGSFLLRDSDTKQGAYCLCVREALIVHTYRLVNSTAGWSLQAAPVMSALHGSGIRQQNFRTIETLIESLRSGSVPGVVPLTDPVDKTQLQDMNFGKDFVYVEMCNDSNSIC